MNNVISSDDLSWIFIGTDKTRLTCVAICLNKLNKTKFWSIFMYVLTELYCVWNIVWMFVFIFIYLYMLHYFICYVKTKITKWKWKWKCKWSEVFIMFNLRSSVKLRRGYLELDIFRLIHLFLLKHVKASNLYLNFVILHFSIYKMSRNHLLNHNLTSYMWWKFHT